MKCLTPAIIGSLLLSGLFLMNPVSASVSSAPQVNHSEMSEAYIEARLKTLLVEDFDIKKVTLSEALAHLDTVLEPHGLQIKFRPVGDKDPVVNLKTRDISMASNLSFLSKQGGYDWWVESGVIIVSDPETTEAMVTDILPISRSVVIKNGPRRY